MTFDEFKAEFRVFLEDSTVNLGRKTAKTRLAFIDAAIAKFDAIDPECVVESETAEKEEVTDSMGDRVLCIKPKNRNKVLDTGKGVHSMTPGESLRADEQLNRSPYGNRTAKKG